MKNLRYCFFMVLLLVWGCAVSKDIDKKSDESAIRSASAQWTDAIIKKDLNKILSIYSPEAVQLVTSGHMCKGRDQIAEWYKTWLLDTSLQYSAETEFIDIAESGDLAYERGLYKINDETGRFITVWKKIDGIWKAVSDCSVPEK